ncbi:MAG: TIM barrel protein [Clostridiales bacterium]|jgi:3-dehydroshikimate dehydratase|nr:TIM barrel protein [Clostridiales bacterium]
MLYGGLVSITFRDLPPREIIDMVQKSGLKGIEWGGDIHVPHGNLYVAREIGNMTRDAGLSVAAFGSYYRVGWQGQGDVPYFEEVLETALELQTNIIRVWAGRVGSEEADEEIWDRVVEDSVRIGNMAREEGVLVAYEYHGGTLTDTLESTRELIKRVNHPNILTYWQPLPHHDFNSRLEGLKDVLPWLANVHTYHWVDRQRLPLEKGEGEWSSYLEVIKGLSGDRYLLLEFVKDNSPEQFLKDAEVLRSWLDKQ